MNDKTESIPLERLELYKTNNEGRVTTLDTIIRDKTTDPEFGFRLITSPLKPNQLKMTLDRENEGDQVVESEGVKILILSPEVASALKGMVMDYQETPEGAGFSISELTPDT